MSLSQQVGASNYLSSCLAAHPDLEKFVHGEQRVDETLLLSLIDALIIDYTSTHQTELASEQLLVVKQRFAFLWALAELDQSISFTRLGQLQSNFADKTIQSAFAITWHSEKMSKYFPDARQISIADSGIFVFGLGKLGGADLNFSSDIDLIAFYDKTKLKLAPMHGASYAVTQFLQQFTSVLSERSNHGFVWRVDWRLRPYASLRNLSMVADKALDFYHYHARPWHRLAMIKARPVAGNLKLAHHFLNEMRSFLWRHDLDYRAIDDIAHLKSKINLEHPALQLQRSHKEQALDNSHGFNLKLGHGGIREIEFIVNALQLLWGGRKPALRQQNTLQALAELESTALIKHQDANNLRQAYQFLRRAENHLQMLDNDQIYHVPREDQEQELASFLLLNGNENWNSFDQALYAHRKKAYSQFEQFFSEKIHQTSSLDAYIWNSAMLSDSVQEIVRGWEEGFLSYGVSESQSHHFEPVLTGLSHEIHYSGCDIDTAIIQIDDYFKRLPPGGQYFRLLRDYPWLLEKLISPLLLSPAMTNLLQQSPHIIDCFLEGDSDKLNELDTTIVFTHADYETRLENLRRLANEELYLNYSDYFNAKTSPGHLVRNLTNLAQELLIASLLVACDEMDLTSPPIAIIGFGKLGSQGMMPQSDLDLVYLCDSMADHVLASQFASKLNTIINTPMKEGRVYELDTRLRPSGRSGSVTISLQSFQQHQLHRAHTWPHLALVPARFVAGDETIGLEFNNIKRSILSRPRELIQFKLDCAKMLKRVQDQRIVQCQSDAFAAKLRPGGLFELEYIVACLSILHCIDHPEAANLGYAELVQHIDHGHEQDIGQALKFLQVLQLEIRLFGQDDVQLNQLPSPVIEHVLKELDCQNIDKLIDKLEYATTVTHALCDTFFADVDISDLASWQETQVQWLPGNSFCKITR